jgi:cytochrome c oxidase subunit 3
MSLYVAYGALLAGVILWCILVMKFRAKPWELQLSAPGATAGKSFGVPPAKVGLWVFLAVITSLFALFISAYYMRMGHGHGEVHDWHGLSESGVLWFNSALLLAGSVFMQQARVSAARSQADRAKNSLLLGGLFTLAFLGGQFYAWTELRQSVQFSPANPAIAFFYLLTAVHGLHLIGGLVVWVRTLMKMRVVRTELVNVYLSIELCTVYWHYLLLVWLALFALLLSS